MGYASVGHDFFTAGSLFLLQQSNPYRKKMPNTLLKEKMKMFLLVREVNIFMLAMCSDLFAEGKGKCAHLLYGCPISIFFSNNFFYLLPATNGRCSDYKMPNNHQEPF